MLHKIIIRLQAYLAMKARISEARALFKNDGIRRFIIPFKDGTMEVLSKQEAIALKIEGHLPADLTAKTIYNAAFFFTDTKSKHEKVQSEMPERELKRRMKSYYSWFERHHSHGK